MTKCNCSTKHASCVFYVHNHIITVEYSRVQCLTLQVLVTTDAQWEPRGDGGLGSARYEPALLPCPTIRCLNTPCKFSEIQHFKVNTTPQGIVFKLYSIAPHNEQCGQDMNVL